VKSSSPQEKVMAMRRTTMYSGAGKKLYAVRAADGTFKDIQTYERAHRADMAHKSAAEKKTAAVRKAAVKKAPARKAAKKAVVKKAAVKKAPAKKRPAKKRPAKKAARRK
jgi:hypothetical protein